MKATIWNGAVDGPGLYLGTPEDAYHADPCPAPSLSNSIAKVALSRSLEHAKAKHPRLSQPWDDEEEEKYVEAQMIGSAAHSLAFGIGKPVVEFHLKKWTKKQDQDDRKASIEAGEIPLRSKSFRIAHAMADRARPEIARLVDGSLVAEAMLVWQERGGLWRRGLIDRMRGDARVIVDYKTTARIAGPGEASAALYKSGFHMQEAFYKRGLDVLDPEGMGRRKFWFLYQEQEPPFAVCAIETDEAGRTWADEQVEAACNLWDRALVTDTWPGYPFGPHVATPKSYDLTSWADRAASDETLNPMEFA